MLRVLSDEKGESNSVTTRKSLTRHKELMNRVVQVSVGLALYIAFSAAIARPTSQQPSKVAEENRNSSANLQWNALSRYSGPDVPNHRSIVSDADGQTRHVCLSASWEQRLSGGRRILFWRQKVPISSITLR